MRHQTGQSPKVVIRDGTIVDPINPPPGFVVATATATLSVQEIVLDAFGTGYNNPPLVTISDPTGLGTGATATAVLDNGVISAITLKKPGSGYVTSGGIQKFTDPLPDLCDPGTGGCPTTGKYIPLGVPEKIKYPLGDPKGIESDQYDIGLVQYRTSFSSSLKDPVSGLPVGTLVRGYVQIEIYNLPYVQ